ncbi:PKD domain-containing protein [Kribbella sp. NPDC000426]|uniref:PKD domain-containing protein n=1 Tax=Kribbella sp. NPDC000426 TaxID=3154255 RepID=UPI00331DBDFE
MKVKNNKDKVTAGATQRTTNRLDLGKPEKKTSSKPKHPAAGTSKPRRSKDDLTTTISDRDDIKLNIGVCGRMQPDGTVPGPSRCQPVGVDERNMSRRREPRVVTPRPQDVTWEEVRSETKDIMFPGLPVKVQPNGRTLVNLDTIVYTEDNGVARTTVTLLGFPVVVEATPINYTWRFGDGSPALTTSTPGKPYPSKEITHKYMNRGNVSLTVTTDYAARFNVAGTGWQYVEGTVAITGPATPLLVREAVPVLVDPGR